MEMKKFIAAHDLWKVRLRTAINLGQCEFSVEQTRVDNLCAFGKFFHALPAAVQASEQGRKVREKHAAFHREAARVLELALGGKKDQANGALAQESAFTRLSAELTQLLTDWEKQVAA